MNGLSRVVGLGPRVMLNGKEYQVRGKTNRFFAEVDAAILARRGNPFDMIVDAGIRGKIDNDPELLTNVVNQVVAKFRDWQVATYRDYMAFLSSPEGDALTVFHCLKKDAPELTLDEVRHYVINLQFRSLEDPAAQEEKETLFKAIEVASGEDHWGNSNGQIPTEADLAKTGS